MAQHILYRVDQGEFRVLCDAQSDFRLDFPLEDVVFERQGDNLVLSFEDGTSIVLENFYVVFTETELPSFELANGTVLEGEQFFAEHKDILPSADDAEKTADDTTYNSQNFTESALYNGINKLDGLDLGWNSVPEEEHHIEGNTIGENSIDGDGQEYGDVEAPVFSPLDSDLDLALREKGVGGDGARPNEDKAGQTLDAGQIAVSDESAIHFIVQPLGTPSPYGTLTVDATGKLTYTLNDDTSNSDAANAVNKLPQGTSITETYTVLVTDASGNTTSVEVTVNIIGTNDRPTIEIAAPTESSASSQGAQNAHVSTDADANHVLFESGVGRDTTTDVATNDTAHENDAYAGNASISGSVNFGDVDAGDTPTLGIAVGHNKFDPTNDAHKGELSDSDSSAQFTPDASGMYAVSNEYGTFVLNSATGEYTFTLADNVNVDALRENELIQNDFTVYVQDEHGAWNSQTITVNIVGTNDKPVLAKNEFTINSKEMWQSAKFDATDNDAGETATLDYAFTHSTGKTDYIKLVCVDGKIVFQDRDGNTLDLGVTPEVIYDGEFPFSDGDLVGELYFSDIDNGRVLFNPHTPGGTASVGVGQMDKGDSIVLKDLPITVTDAKGAFDNGTLNVNITGQDNKLSLNLPKMPHVLKEEGVYSSGKGEDYSGNRETEQTDKDYAFNEKPLASEFDSETNWQPVTVGMTGHDSGITGMMYTFTVGSETVSFIVPNGAADGVLSNTLNTKYGTLSFQVVNGKLQYKYELTSDKADALNEGQKAEEHITISVNTKLAGDDTGTAVEGTIDIAIHGTNDRPVITEVAEGIASEENVSASDISVEGTVSATDADTEESDLRYGIVEDGTPPPDNATMAEYSGETIVQGKYGYIVLNPVTGKYTYTLDTNSEEFIKLRGDEAVEEEFWVQVRDKHGAFAKEPQKIVITVQGKEDGFSVQSATVSFTEDALDKYGHFDSKKEGQLKFPDADANDEHAVKNVEINGVSHSVGDRPVEITGHFGVLTIKADGSYSYELFDCLQEGSDLSGRTDEEKALYEEYQNLSHEGKHSEKFTVTVESNGESKKGTITVEVNGANDEPEMGDGTGAVPENKTIDISDKKAKGTIKEQGDLDAVDIDSDDVGNTEAGENNLTFGFLVYYDENGTMHSISNASYAPEGATVEMVNSIKGQYGTYTITNPTTGEYEYVLDNITVKDKNKDTDLTDSVTVAVRDENGLFGTTSITTTIIGAFDKDSSGVGNGTVPDDWTGSLNDDLKIEVSENAGQHEKGGDETEAGTVIVDTATADAGDSEGFYYLMGTDNKPTLSIVDEYGTLTIDPATGICTFTLHDTSIVDALDADEKLNLNDYKVGISSSLSTVGDTKDVTTDITVTIHGTNDAPELDLDTAGAGNDAVLTVKADDDNGSNKSDDSRVEVTDKDADDSHNITIKDASGASHSLSITTMLYVGTDGSLTGTAPASGADYLGTLVWDNSAQKFTFTANNASATLIALTQKGSVAHDFTVSVTDSYGAVTSQDLTVKVNGDNSAPTLTVKDTSAAIAEVSEDADNVTVGGGKNLNEFVTISDADSGETANVTFEAGIYKGAYGTLIVKSDGTYSYTLNNDKVQHLGEGDKAQDSFDDIRVKDEHGTFSEKITVNIDITGTMDKPELSFSGKKELTIAENVAADKTTQEIGKVTGADKDTGDLHYAIFDADGNVLATAGAGSSAVLWVNSDGSFSSIAPADGNYYGSLTLGTDGKYSFELNQDADVVKGLNEGENKDFEFHVGMYQGDVVGGKAEHDDYSSEKITVTIEGKDNNVNGDNGDNMLLGGAGNDIISGGAGDDILFGDAGDDVLYGGAGNDILIYDVDDKIYGNEKGKKDSDIDILVSDDADSNSLDALLGRNSLDVSITGAGIEGLMQDESKSFAEKLTELDIESLNGNKMELDKGEWTANADGKTFTNGDYTLTISDKFNVDDSDADVIILQMTTGS